MKLKKILSFLVLGIALVALAACGKKSTEDIIKTELKDSYLGSSSVSAYDGLVFSGGRQELIFDKKNKTIKSGDKEIYYKVVSDKSLPTEPKVALKELEKELDSKNNFTIVISYQKDNLDNSDSFYQIVLSEGGKKIRIIELRRDYAVEGGYFDFAGESE
ncbi:LptM family lipoprotein [Streptococcus milleri]